MPSFQRYCRDLPDGYDGRGDGHGPCGVAPQHFRWPNQGSIDIRIDKAGGEGSAATRDRDLLADQPAAEVRALIDTTQKHWSDILGREIDGCVETIAPVLVSGPRRNEYLPVPD